jgi:asparagine N-glycosylation enzyme membrane subunit Stt3
MTLPARLGAHCILVYFLAKKLSGDKFLPAVLAGVSAALYGTLAFFDGDYPMIFLILFFVDACLLILLECRQTKEN